MYGCVFKKLLIVLWRETAVFTDGSGRFWRETETVALDLENRDYNNVIKSSSMITKFRNYELQSATFVLLYLAKLLIKWITVVEIRPCKANSPAGHIKRLKVSM